MFGEREELKALTEELGRELHQSKAQLGEQRTQADYLDTQLEVNTIAGSYIVAPVIAATLHTQERESTLM